MPAESAAKVFILVHYSALVNDIGLAAIVPADISGVRQGPVTVSATAET